MSIPRGKAYDIFSLLFRDHTNKTYSKLRQQVKRKGTCPICGEPLDNRKVEAIHKHGFSREDIVKQIIGDKQEIEFEDVVSEYDRLHREQPIVAIGCHKCHKEYGSNPASCKRVIPDTFFQTSKEVLTDELKRVARELAKLLDVSEERATKLVREAIKGSPK